MKAGEAADEIDIFDEIGMWGVTAKDFIGELRALKSPAITLSINSPGGSVFDGIAMYNALRNSGKKITCRVLGVAASAASFVAMAGDKIIMPENAYMMIHNPIGAIYGNAEDMRDLADTLDKIGESITNTYVARTGKSVEDVKALLAAETWLTAAEAVEMGFADEMEPLLKVAACFETGRLPENVQLAMRPTEPAPDQPTNAIANEIAAVVKAAGLEAHTAMFALAYTDLPAVQAAISDAREIIALCDVAGKPQMADQMIKARTPLADVRASLLDALAKEDEATQTDGTQPSAGTPKAEQPTASIKTADIWAARRKS
jgi:ATP-dependent Clp protease, protease subunit